MTFLPISAQWLPLSFPQVPPARRSAAGGRGGCLAAAAVDAGAGGPGEQGVVVQAMVHEISKSFKTQKIWSSKDFCPPKSMKTFKTSKTSWVFWSSFWSRFFLQVSSI